MSRLWLCQEKRRHVSAVFPSNDIAEIGITANHSAVFGRTAETFHLVLILENIGRVVELKAKGTNILGDVPDPSWLPIVANRTNMERQSAKLTEFSKTLAKLAEG